ncbi:MFS transporter [Okibacterium endophyticum]
MLTLPTLLVAIDNTVLSFAIPSIARDLQPSGPMQLWIIDVYSLVLAGLLVAMGNLGDRFGRRRMLLIGCSGFAIVSALAAFAHTAELLLVARILLGIFGASIMPATLSLLRSTFTDRNERRLAIAVWATGFSAGSAIGPILGGVLLEHFWWGSVFLVAVPILIPLLVLAPILITESRDPDPGPVDIPSILLSMGALAPGVFAIKHIAVEGIDPLAVGLVLAAVACGILFVRRLLRRPNPMLDMRLFRLPAFAGGVMVNLVSVIALVGFIFFAAQHLQLVAGLTALDAALAMVPGTLVIIGAGLLVVRVVRRVRAELVMAIGVSLSAVSYTFTAIVGENVSVFSLILGFCILGAGVGAAETLSNDMIVSSVPEAKAGAASAVSETAYELGAVLGTAVLGSALTAAYQSHLRLPDGLTPEQQDAAHNTLGGAVSVAEDLPGDIGESLLQTARAAFDSGITLTSAIGAGLMVIAVVVCVLMMRRRTA